MAMQVPILGKVKNPVPLVVGLIAAGVLAAGGATYLVVQNSTKNIDLQAYTISAQAEKNLTVRVTASGTVVPIQTVNLSPKTAGRLVRLFVDQGDRVRKGQVIAQMDDSDVKAQVAQLQANLAEVKSRRAETVAGNRSQEIAQAQAQVEVAQARLNLSNAKVKRNLSLADQGAISRDRLDELIADDASARANLRDAQKRLDLLRAGSRPEDIAQAQAAVAAAAAQLKAAQVTLNDTVIRAPFDGIVTQKYATEGAFVTPTTSASTTTSATSTSIVAIAEGLEALAKVPEVDIGQIKVEQPVEIAADAFPGEVFKGKVRLVSPEAVVEQNVTTFQVRTRIISGFNKLRSGMNIDLTFLGAKLPNALVVPTVAIVTEKGRTGVYVPGKDNKPEFRAVTIGSFLQDKTQVLSGIDPGQRVFIDFPENLKPKQDDQE
ncbi:MAG: efflux RND transporter periplasmic adaptor subunit [Aphanocapsa sp. GSE-SYN-MK-11-07L]|jgi:HlyD family secretion protein|nr:efflux RND transporter periplasmic adaptor subunit [Aphanocapsa sp. GSE-SYN-MK-11-07L]